VARKSPADYTGRQAEKLAEDRKDELDARKGKITTVAPTPVAPDNASEDDDIVFSYKVEANEPMVRIRVNTDLEQVTIGYGNTYNFYRDRWYKVPKHVADHLERLGYVYH